jgi:D-alanine-D-alanine ligase
MLRFGGALSDIGLVVVLVPTTESADPALDYYHDYGQSHAEFARAFDALALPWRWQPVTTGSVAAVLDALAAEPLPAPVVVFNLCDGDDSNDVPGIEVIHHLDRLGLAYTGADASFYRGTTSKIWMKQAFEAAGVATSPWTVVPDGACDADAILAEFGAPLIVKPAISAGSMGITLASVVSTAEALREQVARLHDGYRGWNLVSGGVFVERFIAGREFTTFVVGDGRAPEHATVYPPVERDFHATLPPTERFLSYDRLWEVYEGEAPIGDGEHLWEYAAVPAALHDTITALSWAAYAAVGGTGYGRVDLRMDTATGALHVLEVNAQCGLSEDEDYTSIGAILRLAGRPFAGLVQEILADAIARRPAMVRRASA